MVDLNRKHRLKPFWVGTASINERTSSEPSAVIQIEDTNGGFLTARVTTAQRDAIPSPTAGVMVWNVDISLFEVWNGTEWLPFPGTIPTLTYAAQQVSSFTVDTEYNIFYPLATIFGAITVLVPAGAVQGDKFIICDSRSNFQNNACTIDFTTNGYPYHSLPPANVVLSTSQDTATFVYINAGIGWVRES